MRAADAQQRPFVLVTMDKTAGEGLDLPTLNTLFVAVPVSFKGRVFQQLGRIARGRTEVSLPAVVHAYRDKDVPLLERMYARRRRVMAKEGFQSTERAMPSSSSSSGPGTGPFDLEVTETRPRSSSS